MLNADSSTLKSESEVQPTNRAPITPSVAALSCTERTTLRMPSTELDGNALFSSVTRKLDSSARPAKPSRARARKRSGTKESSAKYAIIAARCVPRSAKNFEKVSRICTVLASGADGRRASAHRSDRDLVADRGGGGPGRGGRDPRLDPG